eukprot:12440548-Alexandrium_andersonii.AAC.1
MAVEYSDGCRAFRFDRVRNCLRRSKLEPRGPVTASKQIPKVPEGCLQRTLFAQMPNLPTKPA